MFKVGDIVEVRHTTSRVYKRGDIVRVKETKILGETKTLQYCRVGDDPGFWLYMCFEKVKPKVELDEKLFNI